MFPKIRIRVFTAPERFAEILTLFKSNAQFTEQTQVERQNKYILIGPLFIVEVQDAPKENDTPALVNIVDKVLADDEKNAIRASLTQGIIYTEASAT